MPLVQAILLCSPVLREYLINYARSLIYTTALGMPTLALIKCGYRLMRDGQTRDVSPKPPHLIPTKAFFLLV